VRWNPEPSSLYAFKWRSGSMSRAEVRIICQVGDRRFGVFDKYDNITTMPATQTLPLQARPPKVVPYEQVISLELNPPPPPRANDSSMAYVLSQTQQPPPEYHDVVQSTATTTFMIDIPTDVAGPVPQAYCCKLSKGSMKCGCGKKFGC